MDMSRRADAGNLFLKKMERLICGERIYATYHHQTHTPLSLDTRLFHALSPFLVMSR